jgi:hypothetical protein
VGDDWDNNQWGPLRARQASPLRFANLLFKKANAIFRKALTSGGIREYLRPSRIFSPQGTLC